MPSRQQVGMAWFLFKGPPVSRNVHAIFMTLAQPMEGGYMYMYIHIGNVMHVKDMC